MVTMYEEISDVYSKSMSRQKAVTIRGSVAKTETERYDCLGWFLPKLGTQKRDIGSCGIDDACRSTS